MEGAGVGGVGERGRGADLPPGRSPAHGHHQVAVGNRAAAAWAEADARAVVIAAASDDGQAALRGAADAFTDAGKGDKARAVANVAMLAGVVAQMGALAGRVAQQSSTLAEEMRRGLELEGLSIVVEMLQTTPAGGGWTALAVLHARQPQTVAPDVTQHPHAGILAAALAGAAVRVQVSDRFDEAFQRGRGAPWPLRIAYETLIDVPAAARNGGIARLEYPLRGDGDATLQAMLYPEGRLKLSRDWGRFLAALKVVDRFSVPADGGMSAWLPIRVRSFPVRTGGVLRLDVSLPPGSDKGPRILRRVLRRLGARSYPQWRAWLALAYLRYGYLSTRFHCPQPCDLNAASVAAMVTITDPSPTASLAIISSKPPLRPASLSQ